MPDYRFTLKSCPNPDYGQTTAPAPPRDCVAETLEQVSRQIGDYVEQNELGSGNFPPVDIYLHQDGNRKWFARGSYNGRIWAEREYVADATPLYPAS